METYMSKVEGEIKNDDDANLPTELSRGEIGNYYFIY